MRHLQGHRRQPKRVLRGTVEAAIHHGWSVIPLTTPLVLTSGCITGWRSGRTLRPKSTTPTPEERIGFGQYNSGAWPSPLVTSGGGNFNYCIYATGSTASLTSIAMTPANPGHTAGASQQFTATGTYSDGTTQNLTSQATWSSSAQRWPPSAAAGWPRGFRRHDHHFGDVGRCERGTLC